MATTRQQKGTGNDTASSMPSTEDVVNDVKASANEAFGQAKEKVSQAADQAQKTAKSQLADRKDQVADGIDSVASALRQTSQQMEGQDVGPVGSYVGRAASALSDISQHVRENNVDQLLHEVESFARREPAIALGSAFAIGVIAARFLKSSNQRRYNTGSAYNNASNSYSGNYTSSNQYPNTSSTSGNYASRSDDSDAGMNTGNSNYLGTGTGGTNTSGMAEES